MSERKKGCGFGCIATGAVVALVLLLFAVVLLGAFFDQARARTRAGLGLGSSAGGDGSDVSGLPDDVPLPAGSVDDIEPWTMQPARTVDNRGTRKGLIYYPRIGGSFPYLDRAIKWNLDEVLTEYPMRINYAFRPTWKQRQLWLSHLVRRNPNGVAPPGTSIHESGCAVDTDFRSISFDAQRRKVAVFAKYGFTWKGRFTASGLKGDPVHFEIRPEKVGWRSAVEAIRYNQAVYTVLAGG